MLYAIKPEGLAERLALAFGLAPLAALDVLIPLVQVRALMAAVRLGVIEALQRPARADEVASRCGLDPTTSLLLLRVLASSRYVRQRRGRFELSSTGRAMLLPGGPHELRGYVEHNYAQWSWLEGLESTLETGRGVDFHERLPRTDAAWSNYQRSMLELARPAATTLARLVPVRPGARRLLDLGGGHGLLGAAICRAHPPLTSTVIDLEAALPEARRLARLEGIEQFVTHRAGDLRRCELEAPADVIVIASLLHHMELPARDDLLRRAHAALSAGGTLAIWEIEARPPQAAPELASDAIALFFRVTSSATALDATDLLAAVRRAGFGELEVARPSILRGRILICARKAT